MTLYGRVLAQFNVFFNFAGQWQLHDPADLPCAPDMAEVQTARELGNLKYL